MMRKIIPYNPKLIPLAKKLRKNSTLSEILLWQKINKKQLKYDFHRQKPIGNYIVDLYCPDLLLAVEIDGSSHHFNSKKDLIRQNQIEELGVSVIRFSDLEIKKELDSVMDQLRWVISQAEKRL